MAMYKQVDCEVPPQRKECESGTHYDSDVAYDNHEYANGHMVPSIARLHS